MSVHKVGGASHHLQSVEEILCSISKVAP